MANTYCPHMDPAGGARIADALLAALPCRCDKCICEGDAARNTVSNVSHDTAVRFLRSCKGNLPKAAHKLTSTCLWRRAFGADRLLEEPVGVAEARAQAVQPFFPMGVLTIQRSRSSDAVYILRAGHAEPAAGRVPNLFGGESGVDTWLRHHVRCNELCLAIHPQKLVIWDLDNLGRKQLTNVDTLRHLRRLIEIDVRHYPLTVRKVLVVNSPYSLQTIWPAIAAMMDADTLSRVQILGRVSEPEVRAALLAEMDEQALPDFLGGAFGGPLPAGLVLPAPDVQSTASGTWSEYIFGSYSLT